jgi:hypothetical protein
VEGVKALSRGTKLVLVAGPLLFFSLFFTWQNLEVDFGPAGRAVQRLDGWDAWGLLIGLLVMTVVTLAVLTRLTDVEMSEDVPWETVMLALGGAVVALALLKNLTDADSTWTSYGFVALAAALAAGTYLNWTEASSHQPPLLGRRGRRRRFSSAA